MAVSGTDLLWGCPQMNFKANPPFNEMRQGFATFKKEIHMAHYLHLPGLFEKLSDCLKKLKILIQFLQLEGHGVHLLSYFLNNFSRGLFQEAFI